MHVFFCFGRFWLQASHGYKVVPFVPTVFQAESKSPCTPVLAVPNTIIIWNYVGLFRPDSELGHATVCYKCIRTHTLLMSDEIWIYIYIYMFVACNRWVRIKKRTTVLILIHSAALSTPPAAAEDDVSDRPQVTSRRQQVPTDHPQDFGVETCWSQASAMSRCGHVFTVLIFLFFWLWSFCMYGHVEAASLSLCLSLLLFISPSPYLYLYIYLLYVSYIYIYVEYISNQASFHSVSTRQKLSYFEWSHPDTLFWHSFWQSFGSIYMESILTFYLTLFLAFYLASSLTFCLTYFLESILTYFLASILTLFLASIMALYLASILAFILTFFLANTLTFLSGTLFGIYSDILSGILTGRRSRAPLHSGLAIWLGSIGAHSHAEIRRAGRGVDDRKEKEGRKGRKELHLY